jgi:protein-tyrosine phosphatase
MSCHTITRLSELGVVLNPYLRLPMQVTVADFARADHVVAVKEAEHRPLIEKNFPSVVHQVEFWQVDDLDCAGPEVAIPHLERHVGELLERFKQLTHEAA